MKDIKFTTQFVGKGKRLGGWECFMWIVSINGEQFEYNAGLAHFTPYVGKKDGSRETVHDSMYKKNKKPENSLANGELEGWLHVPQLNDVLECLFLDASSGQDSFNDFCDNCGYSNDSLKALDIYRACMAIVPKLRKALGEKYNAVKEEIEALNE